ncbi:helix-turn-helix domain-containing protein, partial [Streptomyces sp. NPDC093984]|uniref:helix-turn-helix domain-containing protein n=1 Tax=Streptomyces sp. NPDC093984 TaxID=3366052 RepID=UPI00382E0FB7
MDATTPGPLAPEVLDRDDLKQALAEHDFAAAFSLIKKWGGLSQNRIAAACQLTPGKVSTIISGQQQVTSFDVICRIADGLRIPGRMVGLADRPWERPPDTPEQPTRPPATRLLTSARQGDVGSSRVRPVPAMKPSRVSGRYW